ncbi:MAG: hypothetical protein ACLFWD_01005 [Anaerolineales bacterium]
MKPENGVLPEPNQLVPKTPKAWLLATISLFSLGVLVILIAEYLPIGVDWEIAFRPAALAVVNGESPYSIPGFFNPPWTIIPLIPLAVLPARIGWGLYTVIGFLILGLLAIRFKANRITFALLLSSPPVLHGVLNGNLDWLALSGLLFPRWLGLFFISMKPQIGIGVAVYWIVNTYQRDGGKNLLLLLAPIGTISVISILMFGPWPLRSTQEIDLWWNASLWPWSIPFGLAFLLLAIRDKKEELSLVSSPMLSPYVLLHSWVSSLFAVLKNTRASILVIGGIWLWVLIRAVVLY